MKAKDLVQKIQSNLREDAEVDFLLVSAEPCWLDLRNVTMNADVDDPDNRNRGGLVFTIKGYLS